MAIREPPRPETGLRSSQSATTSGLIGTGTDDVLYIGGWIDVNAGLRMLNVRYLFAREADPARTASTTAGVL